MNGLNYTSAIPYLNVDGIWEVEIDKKECSSLQKDDVLQTGSYAFYVDSVTNNEKTLTVTLTPKQ